MTHGSYLVVLFPYNLSPAQPLSPICIRVTLFFFHRLPGVVLLPALSVLDLRCHLVSTVRDRPAILVLSRLLVPFVPTLLVPYLTLL